MQNLNQLIFDSHLHIIDPEYPLFENQGYLPQPFTVGDYKRRMSAFELAGGAVVSGSFQRFDQSYLINALKNLGDNFVGVTQLKADTDDETILSLHQHGVRAVRFNLKRGGSEDVACIKSFAARIYELAGWHVELYVDSVELSSLKQVLLSLPKVSIDHLGLSKAGLPLLLALAEKGVKVKATGFGRLDFPPELALKSIYSANPNSLMFGTDLPSTRAPRPFNNNDILLVQEALGEAGAARVLSENALDFYVG